MTYDPFYQFEQLAHEDGKPPPVPVEPKAATLLRALLGSKAALVVMTCLLVVVAFTLIVLLTVRLA